MNRFAFALALCSVPGLAGAVTVWVDSPMSNCVVVEDFKGGDSPATAVSESVRFEKAEGGACTYRYGANAAPEGFMEFVPSKRGWNPAEFRHLRARFRIRKGAGEGPSPVEVYPSPVADAAGGAGHRTVVVPPSEQFAEWPFDLASATAPLNAAAIDGRGLRFDAFNYGNDGSADAVDIDYFLMDRGRALGSEFDRDGDFGGFAGSIWRPVNVADAKVEAGSFRGRATSGDPMLGADPTPVIDPAVYGYVEIRMKTDLPGQAQLFFQNASGGWGDPPDKDPIFDVIGDNEFHVYLLNLSDDGYWKAGPITHIRFDPTGAEGAAFEIDYIRVMETIEVP
jgi:hypothetical protein